MLGYSEWMNTSLILCFILNTQMLLLHYTSLCTLCKDFSISVTSLSEKKTASESSIIFLLNRMLPDDNSGEDICFCKIVEIFLKWKANADERWARISYIHLSFFVSISACTFAGWNSVVFGHNMEFGWGLFVQISYQCFCWVSFLLNIIIKL